MTKSEWVLFAFTFVVGMTAGMYLYVTSFRPVYQVEELLPVLTVDTSVNITGRSYGGMRSGYEHPTFRIIDNGDYAYLPGGMHDTDRAPAEGRLPRSLYRDIEHALAAADLEALSEPATKEQCNLYVDGIDYAYRIIIDGMEYEVDTCGTAATYDDELIQALDAVWEYLASEVESSTAPPRMENEPVACTADAKICPDGTAVGRTAPNCEFAPCPGE